MYFCITLLGLSLQVFFGNWLQTLEFFLVFLRPQLLDYNCLLYYNIEIISDV